VEATLTPSHSATSLSTIMTSLDVNLLGNVHGGVVMKLVDSVAGAVAQRHSGGPAVTAAMDEMAFLQAVHVGDLVQAHALINWAGRSSMEIGVHVETEPWNRAGVEPLHVASAYLVFVAIGTDGGPRVVPGVRTESAEEERRYREAEIRREHRLARRAAIEAARGS
jgi:acyl-CoA hydrolase